MMPACGNYRLDMAAASFGDCKCGRPKHEHAADALQSARSGRTSSVGTPHPLAPPAVGLPATSSATREVDALRLELSHVRDHEAELEGELVQTRQELEQLRASTVPALTPAEAALPTPVAAVPATAPNSDWRCHSFLLPVDIAAPASEALLARLPTGVSELDFIRGLDEATVKRLLSDGGSHLLEQLAHTTWAAVRELQGAEAATGLELHDKFVQAGGVFELSFGGLKI